MIDDPATDSELVAAVVRGDLDAFGALVHRHRDTYTRFAVRMLGDRGDAEEVLDGAWMQAYHNIANCREPKRFSAWLYQIVVIECRAHLNRRTRSGRRTNAAMLDPVGGPGDDLSLEDVERALAELPDEQREAFVLRHVEQMSFEEMAEITGAGVSGLTMRVKRATGRMRDMLEGVQNG